MDYEVAASLDAIRSLMQSVGCHSLWPRCWLRTTNSKNQVYFGGDFQALNLLPQKSCAKRRLTR